MRTTHSLTISHSICWGGCMPCMPPAMHTPCHKPPAIHAPLPCMPPAMHASLLHMLPAMHAPSTHPPCHTCPLPCTPPAMHVTYQAHPHAMHTPPAMHVHHHACPPPSWTKHIENHIENHVEVRKKHHHTLWHVLKLSGRFRFSPSVLHA